MNEMYAYTYICTRCLKELETDCNQYLSPANVKYILQKKYTVDADEKKKIIIHSLSLCCTHYRHNNKSTIFRYVI